jgi:hypothetical protein
VQQTAHSYFDGQGDHRTQLGYPRDGMAEDALFTWARGWAWPTLAPGERREVKLLRSLRSASLDHLPLAWRPATLSRSAEPETVRVPAGEFEVNVHAAEIESGPQWRFFVEAAPPHRLIRWTCSDGEAAELIAADRLKYWELNGPEGADALARLGLKPRPERTP